MIKAIQFNKWFVQAVFFVVALFPSTVFASQVALPDEWLALVSDDGSHPAVCVNPLLVCELQFNTDECFQGRNWLSNPVVRASAEATVINQGLSVGYMKRQSDVSGGCR